MVKDRRISFLRLAGEVRDRFKNKRPCSADQKSQNCLEIDERVGGHWIMTL